jgi:RNA polymerase subunit RPABC4/transcription elongation factor Spt4
MDIEQYKCPTCEGYIPNNENIGQYSGAISRKDNKTEVCSACGTREAMEDFFGSHFIIMKGN